MRSDVQLLRSVEVHEAWLKQNALSLYFVVHMSYRFHHLLFLLLCEDSLRFDVLNNLSWIGGVVEDLVDLCDEISIVYQATSCLVGVNKLVDFRASQVDLQSVEASAELLGKKCNLRLLLRMCLCEACQSL